MLFNRFLVAILLLSASALAWSGPARTKDEAIKIAVGAIHQFKLTTLRDECGVIDVVERPAYFELSVRERHGGNCGGTPETGPRLFSLRVRKHDGKVTSDVYDGTNYRSVDHEPVQ